MHIRVLAIAHSVDPGYLAPEMSFARRIALANLWLFEPWLLSRLEGTPAGISHAHDHGYRDHDKVWPSCEAHHLYQHAVKGVPNRHKNPIEFRERYGTDAYLVEYVRELLK